MKENWEEQFNMEFMADGELLTPEGIDDGEDIKDFIRKLLKSAIDEATEWTLDSGKVDAKLSIRKKELYKKYNVKDK